VLAESLREFWDRLTDPDEISAEHYVKEVLPMVRNVGSAWRVNWRELADAALAD
jgi:hypothetical protein